MKHQYLAYVLDMLQPHGQITAKGLFGGHGIYYKGIIFAVIVENELYFKVDDHTREDYDEYDSQPFVYIGKTKTVTMPYMTLSESILENREELPLWIEKAYQVSLRHKKGQKRKPKKTAAKSI